MAAPGSSFRAPKRSKAVGALRILRMKWGQLRRGSPEPAPVGRPDYYSQELSPTLFVRDAAILPQRTFLAADHREPAAVDLGRECFSTYGVYPLNFSFPQPEMMPSSLANRPHFLSSTIPGEPFSFVSWDDYLLEYQSSYFALSTKKGGWDTFRHLEILFSGTIPLIPRLAKANAFSLAHLPKRALMTVMEQLLAEGPAIPDDHTRAFFADFASQRLSSRAMASYVVEAAGIRGSRIMYLDHGLAARTDYLSAFTLIGLRQLLGETIIPAFEVDYLLDDFSGNTHRLYGRGFGYTKVLPARLRSPDSLDPAEADTVAGQADLLALAESCDCIVVGNYDGNRERVSALVNAGIPEARFVCILGSDLIPDRSMLAQIRKGKMTFFVREFPGI